MIAGTCTALAMMSAWVCIPSDANLPRSKEIVLLLHCDLAWTLPSTREAGRTGPLGLLLLLLCPLACPLEVPLAWPLISLLPFAGPSISSEPDEEATGAPPLLCLQGERLQSTSVCLCSSSSDCMLTCSALASAFARSGSHLHKLRLVPRDAGDLLPKL